jgi:hypothetical protein
MKMYKLFIVLMFGLFLVISCGKPTDPESLNPGGDAGYTIVSKHQTVGFARDLIKKDSLVYIAQGEGGLMIVDVSNPSAPKTISNTFEGVRGYSSNIELLDSIAYISAGNLGVTVVNVSDPYHPVVDVSNFSVKPARSLYISNSHLYVGCSEQGLWISDINIPTYPIARGNIKVDGYAQGIITTSDSVYMIVACGEVGLTILDISIFKDGYGPYPTVSQIDTPGYVHSVVTDDKSIAYLACGYRGLQIVDYSDTANVSLIGKYDDYGNAEHLMLKDNIIYLSAEKEGLQIIDVADPHNPILLGIVVTEYLHGFDMDDEYLYLADENEGLIIISIPE